MNEIIGNIHSHDFQIFNLGIVTIFFSIIYFIVDDKDYIKMA